MAGGRALKEAVGKGIMRNSTRNLRWVEEPFDANGNLKPNVRYKTGKPGTNIEYEYQTDARGRIVRAKAEELKLDDSGRARHNSDTPGKQDGDHAGHLFGDRFGGSPELDNLVSQARHVNLSEFKKIENNWARELSKTPPSTVKVDIEVTYRGNSERPSGFIVTEVINGETVVHRITNTN